MNLLTNLLLKLLCKSLSNAQNVMHFITFFQFKVKTQHVCLILEHLCIAIRIKHSYIFIVPKNCQNDICILAPSVVIKKHYVFLKRQNVDGRQISFFEKDSPVTIERQKSSLTKKTFSLTSLTLDCNVVEASLRRGAEESSRLRHTLENSGLLDFE